VRAPTAPAPPPTLANTVRDTVGAVVVDAAGRLAAAASSGGAWLRPAGRLGAAAVPGAAAGVDPAGAAAAVASGVGERLVGGATAATLARALGGGCPLAAAAAAEAGAGRRAPADPGGGDGSGASSDEGGGAVDVATLVRLSAVAGGGGVLAVGPLSAGGAEVTWAHATPSFAVGHWAPGGGAPPVVAVSRLPPGGTAAVVVGGRCLRWPLGEQEETPVET